MAGLFSTPDMPKIPPPARMPDDNDPRVKEAQKRRRAEIAARGGRQSTILSDALSSKLGAGA